MEVVGASSAAISVFDYAKHLRDRIKVVRHPLHPLGTLRVLIVILYPCPQVASASVSVNTELLAALTEYGKDIDLLESLYNNNKELLDQDNLDTDLKELTKYA